MARFRSSLPDPDMDEGVGPAGLIVLLGENPRDPWRWWRVSDTGLESEHRHIPGDDAPWGDTDNMRVAALVPALDARVRIAPRGDMPAAQAVAAARLSPAGMSSAEPTHVAAAAEGDHVLTCRVTQGHMDLWLAELAAAGLNPDALVPAALVLPAPPNGDVAQGEIGGQWLARTQDAAFAGEAEMVDALAAGATRLDIGADLLADRLAALWRIPPLDLRQGAYVRPRVSFFRLPDWAQLARMAAVLALLGFLILVVEIVRLELDSNALEDKALAAAQQRFPAVTDLASAEAQVNGELLRRGAGGASFDAVTPAVFAAMQPLPNVQLRTLSWQGDGTLAIRAAAPRVEDINSMLIALQADGWEVTVPPETAEDATGATVVDITVRAP